jgi:hypothetical protein
MDETPFTAPSGWARCPPSPHCYLSRIDPCVLWRRHFSFPETHCWLEFRFLLAEGCWKVGGLRDYLEQYHCNMLHSVLVQSGAKHFRSPWSSVTQF